MTTREQIKHLMEDAGLYSPLYDLQIAETASALDERKKMQSIVSKEGRTIIKTTKTGEETIAHPLLSIINQFHRTIMQQMSSLGLNRLKIDTTPKTNNIDNFLKQLEE